MLKSARNISVLVALWACCAQASPIDTKPDDYVARAKQFFRSLYPGLDRNLSAVIIDGNRLGEHDSMNPVPMNNFTISLHDLQAKPNPPACWCLVYSLDARFVFDWQTENKELVIMAAGGPVVNGRTDKFAVEMKRHPKWSDAQVVAALNDAGAKFGPGHKAEFLRALPIQELKPFVGELEVVSAEFYLRDSDSEGGVHPYWFVQAKWHGPEGQEKQCTLTFEPFEGKLMSILRRNL